MNLISWQELEALCIGLGQVYPNDYAYMPLSEAELAELLREFEPPRRDLGQEMDCDDATLALRFYLKQWCHRCAVGEVLICKPYPHRAVAVLVEDRIAIIDPEEKIELQKEGLEIVAVWF